MGEMASDLGGPRKEWICHVNHAIKEKYFDHGLICYCANDYFFVGLMMGIALLQNGQLPRFLPEDIIAKLVEPSNDPRIAQLQNGLQVFGFVQFFQAFPSLLELLKPREEILTPKMLLNLLTPVFSPEGSTAISKGHPRAFACLVRPRGGAFACEHLPGGGAFEMMILLF